MTVMDRLTIDRLHATYHLPPSQRGARERLDRILAELVASGLDEALERSGVADDEEVCVRSVAAPVTLRLDGTDLGLREAWAAALAQALERAIDRGGPGIVRFRSRGHAYVDLALGVAHGDLGRAWAWRRLGIAVVTDEMPASEAHRETARALAAEPSMILPALRAVDADGSLGALLEGMGAGGLLTLAGAAVVLAAPAESPRRSGPGGPGSAAETVGRDASDVGMAAERIVRSSVVAVAARSIAGSLEPAARRALALLAILDADPAALHGGARANAIVEAVAARVGLPEPALRPTEPQPGSNGQTASGSAVAPVRPGGDAGADGDAVPLIDGSPQTAPVDHRVTGWTDRAGVLYLVHLVTELGLAADIAGGPALAGRPARWWLHRLAVELASADDDDPAVLAFVGLVPDARPPSTDEPPADRAERRQVRRLANRVTLALARRLDRRGEPPRAVLASICDRRAEIVADPGWLEVRMSLEAVDLGVRRAGLDRDPGFVPWSGVVLRFVYD